MAFKNIAEEVAEEFASFDPVAEREMQTLLRLKATLPVGMTMDPVLGVQRKSVYNAAAEKKPHRREIHRATSERLARERIAKRILAGERPKNLHGGAGPRPTRWFEEAAKLGIDLMAPVLAAT